MSGDPDHSPDRVAPGAGASETTETTEARAPTLPSERWLATTHGVTNQPGDLADYNLYESDHALREAVAREGAAALEADAGLREFGHRIGRAEYLELGQLANRHLPEFEPCDRFGNRIDAVRFHPAYHALMHTAIAEGLHASPWSDPGPGAHVARAARYYLHAQVEAGHGCPVTMTFAAMPSLRLQPDLAQAWEAAITSRQYDPANRPAHQKLGITVGMAMTEKQGGSDVRANTTRAYPVPSMSSASSPGASRAFELVGHKYFVSAPMCDLFLALAQAPGGLTCFLLPRWRPDGSKNPMQIQRLKRKMGNASNASAETELRGALAWQVGEDGRGVRTIIEMVAMTRFDCMIGSSAGMRMAVSQALHHCSRRSAFGRLLVDQPLMKNVLADLALEAEAALAMTMRMARAMDRRSEESEELLARLCTPVGKYWICKRAPQHAAEAMECIGGSGVMEDCPMPRLFRESPVNAIWEGSGNIQCLDALRAIRKAPSALQAFFDELSLARGAHRALDSHVDALKTDLLDGSHAEFLARDRLDRMALALQAALLARHAPAWVADAFCRSRLHGHGARQFGTLPAGADCERIIERAMPRPS